MTISMVPLATLETTQDFGDLFDHPSLADPAWVLALEAAALGKSPEERGMASRAAGLAETWPQLFTLFCRVGRNSTVPLLLEALDGNLNEWDHAKAIADCWSGLEWPERVLPRKKWIDIWETPGYTVNGNRALPPVDPLLLHRGAVDDGDALFGLSWTRSFEQAEWFAAHAPRFGFGPGVVLTCEVPRECLLADLVDTGREEEQEVIVDVTRVHPLPQPTCTRYAPARS